MFELVSTYKPTGDQPTAIAELTKRVLEDEKNQVLLGVTGSGKTFTVANVIQNVQKPTLILSHNKTLAAQLYQEFRDFFPKNAVEYFVSYYDYYQPESYLPSTDTFIEKDSAINDQIDKLRLAATTSLMTRKDVIIVASVSCIYNLGSPTEYSAMAIELRSGMKLRLVDVLKRLSQVHYDRSEFDFKRGTYRVRGEVVDVYSAYQDMGYRLEIFDDVLVRIQTFEPLTGNIIETLDFLEIYPAKHYIAPQDRMLTAMSEIEADMELRVKELRDAGKEIEAYRIQQRTNYDLEMIREIGYCKGIENYSRYFDGRGAGGTPYTLMDFFPKDYLLVIDESHISVPQIRGMYNGDQARKKTLIDYGFRLPSALDNRPLNFDEFLSKVNQTVYTSATPNVWELERSGGNVTEQLIRPTGIIDPHVTVLPTKGQIDDLFARIEERVARKERVLVTTLTKRMAEELATYLNDKGIKVTYLHSDIDTLERTNILDKLRRGDYDVLIGINLLREGLDLPEVSLVAILDADKEGFLRSESALIQTMGRAARHLLGEVIMYADHITGSMERAIGEVERRRNLQNEYNLKNGITPVSISKPLKDKLIEQEVEEELGLISFGPANKKGKRTGSVDYTDLPPSELGKELKRLRKEMLYEAEMLNFEKAAVLRDTIQKVERYLGR